jgi:hypothetical protein
MEIKLEDYFILKDKYPEIEFLIFQDNIEGTN